MNNKDKNTNHFPHFDLLPKLQTNEGRQFATARLIFNRTYWQEDKVNQAILFFQRKNCPYLCALLHLLSHEQLNLQKSRKTSNLQSAKEKRNLSEAKKIQKEIKNLDKEISKTFEKAVHQLELSHQPLLIGEHYFQEGSKLLDKVAQLRQESEVTQSKIPFKERTRSFLEVRELKKKIKDLTKQANQLTKKAYQYFEKALVHYKKGKSIKETMRAQELFRKTRVDFIFHSRGIEKATSFAVSRKWFKNAAEINKRTPEKHERWIQKHLNQSKIIEEKALIFEKEISRLEDDNKKLNTLKNTLKRQVQIITSSRNFFKKTFMLPFISRKISKVIPKQLKSNKALLKKNIKGALEEYSQTEKIGKINSLLIKSDQNNAPLESYLKSTEEAFLTGNYIQSKQLELDISKILASMEKNEFPPKYRSSLELKLTLLKSLNQSQNETERIEDKLNETPNNKRLLLKGLSICERSNLFEYAEQLCANYPDIAPQTLYKNFFLTHFTPPKLN